MKKPLGFDVNHSKFVFVVRNFDRSNQEEV